MEVAEEDMPITEEDIDILENESTECLVCLQPCSTTSQDLFLYNCTCIYYIHAECFRRWREITQTDRICLICREEIEPVEDNVQLIQIIRRRPIFLPNEGIDARFDENIQTCSKKINDCLRTICIFLTLTIIIATLLNIIVRSLLQFRHA